jgi:hypothetical protein
MSQPQQPAEIQTMSSVDATLQIGMVTNHWYNISEDMITDVMMALRKRHPVYYGYIVVPQTLSDAEVTQVLTCDDTSDTYYEHLIMKLGVDFAWYDTLGRCVMLWGGEEKTLAAALLELRRALFGK